MTLGILLEIFKSRLWLILLLSFGAAGVALIVSKLNEPIYSANATILLDYRKPLEGELAGELLPVGMQSSYLSTQVDIIKSRPVAERVAAELDLTHSPLWLERFTSTEDEPENFSGWLIGKLMENLLVTVGTETRLIDIWFQDANAEMAAKITNAYVDAYRHMIQQLGGTPALETAQSAEKLLSKLRNDLEQAESRVSDYQERMGIIATEERLDVETEHLNELMRERLAADAGLRAAESRLQEAPAEGDAGRRAGQASSEVLGNELIKSLQVDLARKEGELADLATSLGERHPTMQKLRAEIATMREKLAAESDKIVAATRNEAARARRLSEAARQAEEAQRQKVINFKHVRDGLQPLLREVESARGNYDRALQVYSEYAMHGELSQTNISVLKSAQVPVQPPPANVAFKVVSAFVGGLVFALGLALLWEIVDRRVRGKEAVSGLGDVGCLGALPKA